VEPPTLRRADLADIDELVRLRALMFSSMADSSEGAGSWEPACRAALARRLVDAERFAAYVVGSSGPGGPLVSSGVGWVVQHLPGPTAPDGRRGHIGSVSTDEAARRQGHARSVLQALVAWFDGIGVSRIDLRAAPMGTGLYHELGFRPLGGEALSRRRPA
jgi:ribosomal protein S18 acetylase RimI-like enzyme